MTRKTLIAIPCTLFAGMFPSERVFQVAMADGTRYEGIAPRHFCWNAHGQLVGEKEETNGTAGKVAAKLLSPVGKGQSAVEVPDGEVLAVWDDQILDRPTPIYPPNGIAASETTPDVSHRP